MQASSPQPVAPGLPVRDQPELRVGLGGMAPTIGGMAPTLGGMAQALGVMAPGLLVQLGLSAT